MTIVTRSLVASFSTTRSSEKAGADAVEGDGNGRSSILSWATV